MNKVQSYLDRALEGIEVPQEQKNILMSIYTINSFKTILDTLIGISKADQELMTRLSDFFSKEISALNQDQKNIFDRVVSEANTDNLIQVVTTFASNLPLELSNKINENLKLINR